MTVILLPVSTCPRAPAAPATQLLTVTAHAGPPAVVVLMVRGEVDMLTSTLLRDRLLPHVRGTVPHVIVELTGVSFLSAAGLTVLMNARQAAMAASIALYLVASTRQVLLPLTITGLDGMFDITPNLTHALLRAGHEPDG